MQDSKRTGCVVEYLREGAVLLEVPELDQSLRKVPSTKAKGDKDGSQRVFA